MPSAVDLELSIPSATAGGIFYTSLVGAGFIRPCIA